MGTRLVLIIEKHFQTLIYGIAASVSRCGIQLEPV